MLQEKEGITLSAANDGSKPKALVVLLHGYGGNGEDIFRIFQSLQQQFPTVAFAAPNGPFHLQGASYAWVKLSMPFSWQQLETGLPAAAPLLRTYIEDELRKLGLTYEHLILIGFSQGALLSLEVGLTSAVSPKAIIMLAGFFVTEASLHTSQVKPPVYLLAGDKDEVMNKEQAETTAAALSAKGINVQTFRFPGLGHQIDQRVIATVAAILKDQLHLL